MSASSAVPVAIATTLIAAVVGVQAARAQSSPPVYIVNELEVTDPGTFATDAQRQEVLIKKHGGHYLTRGGSATALEGPAPNKVTIYFFDDRDKMQAWRNEPEQKELLAMRDKAAKIRAFAVEGCGDCKPPYGK